MDQELRAFLEEQEARREARMDERFGRMDERFGRMDERFGRMEERIKGVETETRHTRILVEGLNGNIRLLGEAVIGTGERIDSLREETAGRLEEIKGTIGMIRETLVPRLSSLENRVKLLELAEERKNRDVLEVLRERFGQGRA